MLGWVGEIMCISTTGKSTLVFLLLPMSAGKVLRVGVKVVAISSRKGRERGAHYCLA